MSTTTPKPIVLKVDPLAKQYTTFIYIICALQLITCYYIIDILDFHSDYFFDRTTYYLHSSMRYRLSSYIHTLRYEATQQKSQQDKKKQAKHAKQSSIAIESKGIREVPSCIKHNEVILISFLFFLALT